MHDRSPNPCSDTYLGRQPGTRPHWPGVGDCRGSATGVSIRALVRKLRLVPPVHRPPAMLHRWAEAEPSVFTTHRVTDSNTGAMPGTLRRSHATNRNGFGHFGGGVDCGIHGAGRGTRSRLLFQGAMRHRVLPAGLQRLPARLRRMPQVALRPSQRSPSPSSRTLLPTGLWLRKLHVRLGSLHDGSRTRHGNASECS